MSLDRLSHSRAVAPHAVCGPCVRSCGRCTETRGVRRAVEAHEADLLLPVVGSN